MKKLLAIALILAGTVSAIEYPPLPVSPGKPPRSAPGTPAKPLRATWNVSATARDVLEISDCPDFSSTQDIAGPYEVREIDGVLCYYVSVPVGYAQAFFRVRRWWGNPWIL